MTTVPAGDLLEFAARRAGAAATGDRIAAAVGLRRAELVALVLARRVPVDQAAGIAEGIGVDPGDIWPGWSTAAAAAVISRGAAVDVVICPWHRRWRVDAYRAGRRQPTDFGVWEWVRYDTAATAERAARDHYGDRLVKIHLPPNGDP